MIHVFNIQNGRKFNMVDLFEKFLLFLDVLQSLCYTIIIFTQLKISRKSINNKVLDNNPQLTKQTTKNSVTTQNFRLKFSLELSNYIFLVLTEFVVNGMLFLIYQPYKQIKSKNKNRYNL
jgi:hypothetical protein